MHKLHIFVVVWDQESKTLESKGRVFNIHAFCLPQKIMHYIVMVSGAHLCTFKGFFNQQTNFRPELEIVNKSLQPL